MAVPADFDAVIASLKLGWYLAEVRGRNRTGDGAPRPPAAHDMNTGDALLLRSEQPPEQREIAAEAMLAHLAKQLTVDTDDHGKSWTDAIAAAADARRHANDAVRDKAWNELAKIVFDFDHAVQQTFAESSETQSSAYQLGRALAESYWALDPKQTVPSDPQAAGPGNWLFLLGEERSSEIQRLVGRLCPYFTNKYTGPAVAGSVGVWRRVAATADWRGKEDASDKLYEQTRRWYELLALGQDPTTLVKPFGLLRNLRSAWRTARAFAPQLLLAAASVVVVFGAVKLFGTPWATGLGATLAGLGFSFSALTAKLKSEAQALTTRLKDDAYSDLVCVSITVVPVRNERDRDPRFGFTSSTRRSVTAALGERALTTTATV